jgi:hypothetical protein
LLVEYLRRNDVIRVPSDLKWLGEKIRLVVDCFEKRKMKKIQLDVIDFYRTETELIVTTRFDPWCVTVEVKFEGTSEPGSGSCEGRFFCVPWIKDSSNYVDSKYRDYHVYNKMYLPEKTSAEDSWFPSSILIPVDIKHFYLLTESFEHRLVEFINIIFHDANFSEYNKDCEIFDFSSNHGEIARHSLGLIRIQRQLSEISSSLNSAKHFYLMDMKTRIDRIGRNLMAIEGILFVSILIATVLWIRS